VNLTEWAQAQGIHVTTAYRWYREGKLPMPAWKVGRLIPVSPETVTAAFTRKGAGLYARVSSPDQKADLDRQVARFSAWAGQAGPPVGDYGSTFSWNLVHGCQDVTTAVRRAGYLVAADTAASPLTPLFLALRQLPADGPAPLGHPAAGILPTALGVLAAPDESRDRHDPRSTVP
jgi:hypothetical protein